MNFSVRKLLSMGLSLLAILAAAGCANSRTTEIGRVSARAHLTKDVASYYEIDIRRPTEIGAPRIILRLPSGQVIERKAFNYTALSKAGFIDGGDEHDFQPSKGYMNALSRYGASFFFNNGEMVYMRLFQISGPAVAVAREGTKNFYTLPLTQEQLEQVFGRPDDSSDGLRILPK
ncbi:MAG: hypothetical protein U1F98_07700 [Verrucomicrobiota bacterium]